MPVTTAGLRTALDATVRVLDELLLPHAIVGGIAVAAWGVVRSTKDIDLYVDMGAKRRDLSAALVRSGFDVPAMEEELERWGVFRSKHEATGIFVDIFDSSNPLGESVVTHRRQRVVARKKRWMCSLEDLIVLKSYSDRERDFDDVTELYAVKQAHEIDQAYVDDWARKLDQAIEGDDVSRRIERAREKAERLSKR